jgi:putative ATPase
LADKDLTVIVRRGASELGAEISEELVASIAGRAGGDARAALNTLELAWQTAEAEGVPLEERHIEDAARRRQVVYDKGGDAHYDFVSAFIKAIRGSDPDAALYYLASMLEGGEDPRYIARRLIVHASEDIGLADSQALVVAVAAAHAVEHVGLPEARLNLAHATIYLAKAPKSNSVITAIGAASRDVRERGALRPPQALRDAHYPGAKKLGHGKGYVYPPDDPGGYDVDHLPDELKGNTYYEPSGSGEDT